MIISELRKALETHDVRLIYIVTDFQNPTGITWTRERRAEFMEVVDEFEVPVIEDNPYGELRYEGEYLPSLTTFDTKNLVCSLGTFSKTFAPGFRLGWIAANPLFIEKLDLLKQNMDLSTAPFSQRVCETWLQNFDFDAHVSLNCTKVAVMLCLKLLMSSSLRKLPILILKEGFSSGVPYRNSLNLVIF